MRTGQGGAKAELNRRLYVGNLSWNVTWGMLKDHFRTAGNGTLQAQPKAGALTAQWLIADPCTAAVLYADILRDREGRSKV